MISLYEDPWFTFRFADDRIIPRFHLEGAEAGRRVSVFKIDPGSGERLGLLAMATVGEGGWVDLPEPIIVKAGDVVIVSPFPQPFRASGFSGVLSPLTRLLHQAAMNQESGTRSMSCTRGQSPTPKIGTMGIRSLYDQRPELRNFHSKAVANSPPSNVPVR
jgi:hypothetical protein